MEAAQILVNRGELVAEKGGVTVDPVTAGLQDLQVRLAAKDE